MTPWSVAALIADCGLPRSEARALLASVLGAARETLLAHPERAVDDADVAAFAVLAARRRSGEPLAYLLGEREFYGRRFAVNPSVLVPRPETELAVDVALTALADVQCPRIADLGTGSGCIAITLALERPDARVIATDTSIAALRVARRNARMHGATNVEFVQGSWFDPLSAEPCALIVSNPPYVALDDPHLADLTHEPAVALTGGSDGLDHLRTLAAGARRHLIPGGHLVLEHGYQQGADVRRLLAATGWSAIEPRADAAGHPRVTVARC